MKDIIKSLLFPGLGLHEGLVEVLGEVDLAVQCGHLLLVVQQFLAVDLLHVSVLVVQSLHLSFCLLESEGLVEKIGL